MLRYLFFTFMWPCIVTKFLFNNTNRYTNFPNLFLSKLYMFRTVSLPIIRSFSLYNWHWYMSCSFDDSFQARPRWNHAGRAWKLSWKLHDIPVPNVEWKSPDDEQRNCPKHVEFLDKNKFGKLVRLLVLLKRSFDPCWIIIIRESVRYQIM